MHAVTHKFPRRGLKIGATRKHEGCDKCYEKTEQCYGIGRDASMTKKPDNGPAKPAIEIRIYAIGRFTGVHHQKLFRDTNCHCRGDKNALFWPR